MTTAKDHTARQFGRLVAIKIDRIVKKSGRHYRVYWFCQCDCGKTKTIEASSLTSGNTKSCGCIKKEQSRLQKTQLKHGLSGLPEYGVWKQMKKRCSSNYNNKKTRELYYDRGIRVCDRWKSFETFYSDMGPRPGPKYSIDRIDNDGNYEPGNCRWTTQSVQNFNRRLPRNKLIRFALPAV